MTAKKDMRSARTERAIMDAMLDLLETEAFESVTVNDICMAASVSRTTFYLYFEDKYALVLRCIDEAIALPGGLTDENMEDNYRRILDIHYKLRNHLTRLWSSSKSPEIRDRLEDIICDQFLEYYREKERRGCAFSFPVEMVAALNSGGVSYLIRWWHRKSYPIDNETMVRYMSMKTRETAPSFYQQGNT